MAKQIEKFEPNLKFHIKDHCDPTVARMVFDLQLKKHWQGIIRIGFERDMVAYDCDEMGLTRRLISVGKEIMKSKGYYHYTGLTDLYVSNKALCRFNAEMAKQCYVGTTKQECSTLKINVFSGVRIHSLDNLDTAYLDYFKNDLKGVLPKDKSEIAVGLDLKSKDIYENEIYKVLLLAL